MKKSIGPTLKTLAIVRGIIEILASIIAGCILMFNNNKELASTGVYIIFGGIIASIFTNILIYAVGEICENVCDIRNNNANIIMKHNEKVKEWEVEQKRKEDEKEPDWKCPKCGTVSPGYFTYCMNCRNPKEGYENLFESEE